MAEVTRCIAQCTECEWEHQDVAIARHEGAKHARKTGHRVIGDQVTRFEFDGVSHSKVIPQLRGFRFSGRLQTYN